MGTPGLSDTDLYALTHWPYQPYFTREEQRMTEPKPEHVRIRAMDAIVMKELADMSTLYKATLFVQLHAEGMTLQKAHAIRLKAGAVN